MRVASVSGTSTSPPAALAGPPSFPVNLVIAGAPVLVVGAGHVARRKVEGLLEAGAVVTVVAPVAVAGLVGRPDVRWHQRTYQRGEVASYRLAISATGVREVDEQIHRDALAAGVPVNVADVPDLCTFTLPAIVRHGQVQVAVSTNGRSPALASWVRDRVAETLPTGVAEALDVVAEMRIELKAAGQSTEIAGWHEAFDAGFVELVANGKHDEARQLLRTNLGLATLS
jgi:precorrin-2 dehydrogenase / sirohydrochlorin ferrochelatase